MFKWFWPNSTRPDFSLFTKGFILWQLSNLPSPFSHRILKLLSLGDKSLREERIVSPCVLVVEEGSVVDEDEWLDSLISPSTSNNQVLLCCLTTFTLCVVCNVPTYNTSLSPWLDICSTIIIATVATIDTMVCASIVTGFISFFLLCGCSLQALDKQRNHMTVIVCEMVSITSGKIISLK